jgi:LAO/AO transport system kinase
MSSSDTSALVDAVLKGDVRAGARLMRDLDDGRPGALDALRALYSHTGRAFVLGVTGNPGAGKSTVVDALIGQYRRAGKRVGVVAVDPTSPFSGGAILGDRIRMQRHATDDGVFIRSLATRGHLGGLSRSTGDVVLVLDAMGYDVVIVETVGVGQDEVDVVTQTETAVVVTVPGLGDDIQAIKAGILEIADVLVVNKADRDGADRTVRDLIGMLELRAPGTEEVEIVRTVATTAEGIPELIAAVDRHRERTRQEGGAASTRRMERATAEVRAVLMDRARSDADRGIAAARATLEKVARRELDPYTAADVISRTSA